MGEFVISSDGTDYNPQDKEEYGILKLNRSIQFFECKELANDSIILPIELKDRVSNKKLIMMIRPCISYNSIMKINNVFFANLKTKNMALLSSNLFNSFVCFDGDIINVIGISGK